MDKDRTPFTIEWWFRMQRMANAVSLNLGMLDPEQADRHYELCLYIEERIVRKLNPEVDYRPLG